MSETDLDRLFAEARATPVQPGADLMARILADALAEQPRPETAAAFAPPPRRGLWARLATGLAEGFGGRGVLAGLGGAACFGLVIGYADPSTLAWLTEGVAASSVTEVQLLPDTDFFLSEG